MKLHFFTYSIVLVTFFEISKSNVIDPNLMQEVKDILGSCEKLKIQIDGLLKLSKEVKTTNIEATSIYTDFVNNHSDIKQTKVFKSSYSAPI